MHNNAALRGHIFCQDSSDLDCRTIFRNLEAEPGLLDRAEVGGEGDKLSDSDGDWDTGMDFGVTIADNTPFDLSVPILTTGEDKLRTMIPFLWGRRDGEE